MERNKPREDQPQLQPEAPGNAIIGNWGYSDATGNWLTLRAGEQFGRFAGSALATVRRQKSGQWLCSTNCNVIEPLLQYRETVWGSLEPTKEHAITAAETEVRACLKRHGLIK